jgi:WD40 repeat protein
MGYATSLKTALSAAVVIANLGALGMAMGQPPRAVEQKAEPQTGAGQKQALAAPLVDALGDPLPAGAFLRLGTQRLRHGGPILALAWSPDGKWLASAGAGSQSGKVCLWDTASGKEIREFVPPRSMVAYTAISPDGALAVSVDVSGTRYVWETATGKMRTARKLATPTPAAFTADGKSIVAVNEQGLLCLLETATLHEQIAFNASGGMKNVVARLSFAPAAKMAAVADSSGRIRLLDISNGKVVQTVNLDSPAACLGLSPDGKVLATAGLGPTIQLWDATTGTPLRRLDGHQQEIADLSWSPDGKTLASASADKTARLWNVSTGQQVLKFEKHPGALRAVAFSPDGKAVASSGDNLIHIWDAASGKDLVANTNHGRIAGVGVALDGKLLLTCGTEPLIRLWNLQSGKMTDQFLIPHARPRALDVSKDGKLLAVGVDDGTIHLLELPAGHVVQQIRIKKGKAVTVALSPDGKLVASVNPNTTVTLWSVAGGDMVRQFKHPTEAVPAMAFSPDGTLLCTGSNKGLIRMFDVASGTEMARLVGHEDLVEQLAFSPDGLLLVSASHDGKARVWDLTTGKSIRALDVPNGALCVAVTADGRMAVTGSGRGQVQLWELATGKQRLSLSGHRGPVNNLSLLPNGRTVVTVSSDGTGLCWDLSGRVEEQPKAVKTLTAEEFETQWQSLRGEKVAQAYQALIALSASPEQALARLKTELTPAPRVDPKLIAQWVAELDSKDFVVREKASAALKKSGDAASPALRKLVENPPSLETQIRARQLLGNQDDPLLPLPARLRLLRALELLERLGTTAARDLAQTLAGGDPEAWQTQEAQGILRRTSKQ